jgi:hypothetical protein
MVVWYAIKVVLPWRVSRWYTLYTSVNIALEVGSFSKVYTYLRGSIVSTCVVYWSSSFVWSIGQVHVWSIGQVHLYGDMVKLNYMMTWSSSIMRLMVKLNCVVIGQALLCGDMFKLICVFIGQVHLCKLMV